jgi:hypothetical protein
MRGRRTKSCVQIPNPMPTKSQDQPRVFGFFQQFILRPTQPASLYTGTRPCSRPMPSVHPFSPSQNCETYDRVVPTHFSPLSTVHARTLIKSTQKRTVPPMTQSGEGKTHKLRPTNSVHSCCVLRVRSNPFRPTILLCCCSCNCPYNEDRKTPRRALTTPFAQC